MFAIRRYKVKFSPSDGSPINHRLDHGQLIDHVIVFSLAIYINNPAGLGPEAGA